MEKDIVTQETISNGLECSDPEEPFIGGSSDSDYEQECAKIRRLMIIPDYFNIRASSGKKSISKRNTSSVDGKFQKTDYVRREPTPSTSFSR